MSQSLSIEALSLKHAVTYTQPGVDPRAEAWTAFYQLVRNEQPIFPGYFDSLWSVHTEARLLVLSGVDPALSPSALEAGEAGERHLRVIDLDTGLTTRCSSVTGGGFRVDAVAGRTLSYTKLRGSVEAGFDVDLDELEWVPLVCEPPPATEPTPVTEPPPVNESDGETARNNSGVPLAALLFGGLVCIGVLGGLLTWTRL